MKSVFGSTLCGLMLSIPFGFWQESLAAGLWMFQIGFVLDAALDYVTVEVIKHEHQ